VTLKGNCASVLYESGDKCELVHTTRLSPDLYAIDWFLTVLQVPDEIFQIGENIR